MDRFLDRFALLTILLAPVVAHAAADSRPFVIDTANSRAVISVDKAGLFSFAAGHKHEVTSPLAGTVDLDTADAARSTIHLDIQSKSLVVNPKGEPPDDVPQVQAAMLSDKCLDVEKYPTITFQSRQVTITAHTDTTWQLNVTGDFTLHGVTKSLTFPATAALAGDTLTAQGQFEFKQSDYGIHPISVAGVVKVEDTLKIAYTVSAKGKAVKTISSRSQVRRLHNLLYRAPSVGRSADGVMAEDHDNVLYPLLSPVFARTPDGEKQTGNLEDRRRNMTEC